MQPPRPADRRRRFALAALLTALLSAASPARSEDAVPPDARDPLVTRATDLELVGEEPAPRLPIEAFFDNPAYSSPALSPSGKEVAALYSRGDEFAVVVRPIEGGELRPLASLTDPDARVSWLRWANDERLLVSLHVRPNNAVGVLTRGTRVIGLHHEEGNPRFLGRSWETVGINANATQAQFQDRITHMLPDDEDHVLIEYLRPGERYPRIRRMHVESGKLKTLQGAVPGVDAWAVDCEARVRVGIGMPGTSYVLRARVGHEGPFKELARYDLYQEDGIRFAGFSRDPNVLYVLHPHDGRHALFEYDISANALGELVYAHETYDVAGVDVDCDRDDSIAAVLTQDRMERVHLREGGRQRAEALERALPGRTSTIVSETADFKHAIVLSSSDTIPPEYFILSRDTQPMTLEPLTSLHPHLPAEHMVPMQPIRYRARDGRLIPGYLTLPKGRVPVSLPVVVHPHGGSRDHRRFDPVVQFLANRGYAVFQPNFRGSSGFGTEHLATGYREWGGAMQDDITDGVQWLIDEGIADPERIGIYGAGYGGYAALMGLVKTPELFRAGASFAGVTSLLALLSDRRFFRLSEHDRSKIGGGWGDRGRLKRNSPADNADKIQVPVLLGHGAADTVVNVRHSRKLADELMSKGKAFEYLEFEDETHRFVFESNRIRFYGKLEALFGEHLAPRAQSDPGPTSTEAPAKGEAPTEAEEPGAQAGSEAPEAAAEAGGSEAPQATAIESSR